MSWKSLIFYWKSLTKWAENGSKWLYNGRKLWGGLLCYGGGLLCHYTPPEPRFFYWLHVVFQIHPSFNWFIGCWALHCNNTWSRKWNLHHYNDDIVTKYREILKNLQNSKHAWTSLRNGLCTYLKITLLPIIKPVSLNLIYSNQDAFC